MPPVIEAPCPSCNKGAACRFGTGSLFRCGDCDLIFLSPQPDDAELAALYGEGYYHSWGDVGAADGYWPLKRALYTSLIQRVELPPAGARILDVGCATGACLEVATEQGWEAHGVDVNPYAVRVAAQRVPTAHLHQGTLEAAGLTPASFHLIILSDVLEHSRTPWALLKTVTSLLVPGGQAVIVTPNIGSWSATFLGRVWPHFKREHLTLFGYSGLRRAIESSGMELVGIAPMPKAMTVAYAAHQLASYPLPGATQLVKAAARLLPHRMREWIINIHMGEMIAITRRVG
ncbi:MAG: class I SAM-dependent methyltransferase [Phaeospirillum sp.]|nr:class I SAM-dependent methyltransferase [Phaeospirillum sp.]